MLKKIYLTASLLFFIFQSSYSQNNDWILLSDGTKKYGKIKFLSTKNASRKCIFLDGNKNKKTYYPIDIEAYSINNFKEYRSSFATVKGQTKKVFLEKMVDGIVDLYYLNGSDETKYYIEKDNEIIALGSKKDTSYEVKGEFIQKSEEPFKKTLYRSLNAAPSLLSEVNKIKYDQKDLVKIITSYHSLTCDSIKCIDYTALIKNKKTFTFELGGSFLRNIIQNEPVYSSHLSPTAGILYSISTSKSGYKNYFKTGLRVDFNNLNLKYPFLIASNTYGYVDFSESYTNLNLPIFIGKNLSIRNSTMSLELGIVNNYFFQKKISYNSPFKLGFEGGIYLNKNRFKIGTSYGYRTTVPKYGYYTQYIDNCYFNPKIGFVIN